MNLQYLFPIFTVISLTTASCNSQTPSAKNISTKETIEDSDKNRKGDIIITNISSENIQFSYLDAFSDFADIVLTPNQSFKINSEYPIWIENRNFKNNTMYLIKPGDSLSADTHNSGFMNISPYNDNIERKNELDVFRYINSITDKSYQKIYFDYIKKDKTKTRIKNLDSIFKLHYENTNKFLADYLANNKVSTEFAKCVVKIAWLEYASKSLVFLWNKSQQDIEVYKSSFDFIYSKIISESFENTCSPLLYKNIEYSYFIRHVSFILNHDPYKTGTYEPPMADSIYNFTKREIHNPDKLNTFLFLTVKEELTYYPKSTQKCVESFFTDCTNEDYKNYLREMIEMSQRKPFEKGDLVLNAKKQEAGLNKILDSLAGNIVYIDIWASWCMPCRGEFPYTLKLRKTYAGKPIKFLYLAIDNNINMWKKAIKQEDLIEYHDSYLLYNFESSGFKKRFKVGPIPRYLLLDKKGNVVNAEAPRPSEEALIPLINELLEK
jgi:thiol-disulfide isomerase/thioredoxin